MTLYTVANNAAADSFDAGKLTREDLITIRDTWFKPARVALNAWGITISADGKTSDAKAESLANIALDAARAELLKRRKP